MVKALGHGPYYRISKNASLTSCGIFYLFVMNLITLMEEIETKKDTGKHLKDI